MCKKNKNGSWFKCVESETSLTLLYRSNQTWVSSYRSRWVELLAVCNINCFHFRLILVNLTLQSPLPRVPFSAVWFQYQHYY